MKKRAVSPDQGEFAFSPPASTPPTEPTTPVELSPLDRRFAELMVRLHGSPHELLSRAAQGVSAARGAGEACLPLERLGDAAALRAELLATGVVGEPGAWQPLIIDSANRLYLQRYWAYEQRVAEAIAARLSPLPNTAPPDCSAWTLAKEQEAAVELAMRSRLALITGGPGTGKTHTVALLLRLLEQKAAQAGQKPPRVVLAAPTGKAAARLTEAVRQAREQLDDARSAAPEAVTLHRLLGLGGNSPRPRISARQPLHADVVIVDEVSLVDLAMMAKLLAAVPPGARLILLGDRHQLPAIETGNVLADLCAAGLEKQTVELRHNFRFGAESGITRLAEAVQRRDAETALTLLQTRAPDLEGTLAPPADGLAPALASLVNQHFRPGLPPQFAPAEALAHLARFRLLCAVREGPFGVRNLNRLVESLLAKNGPGGEPAWAISPRSRHYAGRPIMILRNDYELRLFNGDLGVLLPDAEADHELRAFFPGERGAVRKFSPARLPEHETAWAMTVHKCQGSEFSEVLLVLPDRDSPVISRELIYTAITRARAKVHVWYSEASFRAALDRETQRASGLADAIRQHCTRCV